MAKVKCPSCGSNQLFYYEKREHKFQIDQDLDIQPVSDYPRDDGDIYKSHQVECNECYVSSDDNKELQKVVDKILEKHNRLNS